MQNQSEEKSFLNQQKLQLKGDEINHILIAVQLDPIIYLFCMVGPHTGMISRWLVWPLEGGWLLPSKV
jgi:hypothetical protein